MVYLVPFLCFVLHLILGVFFMRWQAGKIIPVLLLIGAVSIYWAVSYSQQQIGLIGIEYAIFAFLVIAPAMLGLAIGGVVGWVRARRAQE